MIRACMQNSENLYSSSLDNCLRKNSHLSFPAMSKIKCFPLTKGVIPVPLYKSNTFVGICQEPKREKRKIQ